MFYGHFSDGETELSHFPSPPEPPVVQLWGQPWGYGVLAPPCGFLRRPPGQARAEESRERGVDPASGSGGPTQPK